MTDEARREDFMLLVTAHAVGDPAMYELLRDKSLDTPAVAAKPADRHGCYNRQLKDTLEVQDGWNPDGTRHMKTIPNEMTKDCRYDARATNPRCAGCQEQRTVVVEPE